MNSTITVRVSMKMRWWFKPYRWLLIRAHLWFGYTPSDAHIHRIARHAACVHVGA